MRYEDWYVGIHHVPVRFRHGRVNESIPNPEIIQLHVFHHAALVVTHDLRRVHDHGLVVGAHEPHIPQADIPAAEEVDAVPVTGARECVVLVNAQPLTLAHPETVISVEPDMWTAPPHSR